MRLCRERRSCESGPVMGPVCRLSSVVRGLFHQSVLCTSWFIWIMRTVESRELIALARLARRHRARHVG